MKKFWLILLIFLPTLIFAQTTDRGFSFQGYALDANGKPLANTNVTVKFTIYPKTGTGLTYTEEQQLQTDAYGVFTADVGSGSPTDFQKLDFTQNQDYWIKVEVKKTDGGTYNVLSDAQILAVPIAKFAYNGVPVGTIIPFAGPKDKIPDGWLICDGTEYDGTDPQYQQLYNVIGTTWGGDATTSKFRVPDLRGYFMRGVDEGAGIDDDRDTRFAKYSGGNTGDNVGTYENENFRSHDHYVDLTTSKNGAHTHDLYLDGGGGVTSGGSAPQDYIGINIDSDKPNSNHKTTTIAGDHTHTVKGYTNKTGGNETRPDNVAVFYIIKY